MPLTWTTLNDKLRPDQFGLKDAEAQRADPWKDFFKTRQTVDRQAVALLTGEAAPRRRK